MSSIDEGLHLSEKPYWSSKYSLEHLPHPIDPGDHSLRNYLRQSMHRGFSAGIRKYGIAPGSKMIEIGCGGSIWLPYFAREHGLDVTGLDYSEEGCATAEHLLAQAGVAGSVVCADLFDPPERLFNSFDLLASFGVVEHFASTETAIAACAKLLKPGGVMLTTIPNLVGLNGRGVRFFDRALYDIHVPMSREQLRVAHEKAGLEILECGYLGSCWFSDWDVPAGEPRAHRRMLRNLLWYSSASLAAGVWMADNVAGNRIAGSRIFSPWVMCWAKKTA
jgi:2-polyprenyl-3-methyl-5-hydroxy-6-metoxy-1,4-benzoquinol methylase